MTLLAWLIFPPILAVECWRAYLDALRRNSERGAGTLAPVPVDRDLLPVCSCCRMRALRERGAGRICPTCDGADPTPVDTPDRRRPPEETSGGV